MKVLGGLALPEREARMVGAFVKTYNHLQERIDETNALVDELYGKMLCAQLIQTAPGFGKFFAVQVAAWPRLRADFDRKCYYERMKRRKGANPAKVATARRSLMIIYRMLKENRPSVTSKR